MKEKLTTIESYCGGGAPYGVKYIRHHWFRSPLGTGAWGAKPLPKAFMVIVNS